MGAVDGRHVPGGAGVTTVHERARDAVALALEVMTGNDQAYRMADDLIGRLWRAGFTVTLSEDGPGR